MKKLISILLFFLPILAFSQNENNSGWITKDSSTQVTPDGLHFHTYTYRMTRPGNGDTTKHISVWMQPGEGENGGTDTTKLVSYGPHWALNNGWDGSITLPTGGKRYMVIVTCISDQTAPYAEDNLLFMDFMFSTYHVFRTGAVNVTGLSAGAWAWTTMINYQRSAGTYDGIEKNY